MIKGRCIAALIACIMLLIQIGLQCINTPTYADDNLISNTATLELLIEAETNQDTGAPVIISLEPEEPKAYYPLTDDERALVESVVMAEAGAEDYDGQRLVAQCILNACILEDKRPNEIVVLYQYTKKRPEPSESVAQAVAAVFDNYDVVTEEQILVFYAPRWCTSEWHESQQFVLEHGGHRFFAINS